MFWGGGCGVYSHLSRELILLVKRGPPTKWYRCAPDWWTKCSRAGCLSLLPQMSLTSLCVILSRYLKSCWWLWVGFDPIRFNSNLNLFIHFSVPAPIVIKWTPFSFSFAASSKATSGSWGWPSVINSNTFSESGRSELLLFPGNT